MDPPSKCRAVARVQTCSMLGSGPDFEREAYGNRSRIQTCSMRGSDPHSSIQHAGSGPAFERAACGEVTLHSSIQHADQLTPIQKCGMSSRPTDHSQLQNGTGRLVAPPPLKFDGSGGVVSPPLDRAGKSRRWALSADCGRDASGPGQIMVQGRAAAPALLLYNNNSNCWLRK